MLTRRTGVAVALVLVAGAIALLLGWSPSRSLDDLVPRDAASTPPAGEGIASPDGSPRSRVAVGEEEERGAADANPGEATTEAAKFGSIAGGIYDFYGEPLPGRTVLFLGSGAEHLLLEREIRARADEEGQYVAEKVPVGIWKAGFQEEPAFIAPQDRNEPIARLVGEVEVFADQRTIFDVYLPGDRQVSGQFLVVSGKGSENPRPRDGTYLEVEILAKWRSNQVVGRALSVSYEIPPWDDRPGPEVLRELAEQVKAGFHVDGWGEPEPPAYRNGGFAFTGLEPEVYLLRIWMDRRGGFYLEREVDLVEGDVDLPAEEVTTEDFVRAQIEREIAAEAAGKGGGG
ncbi:MAG: hypothetical protein AB1726_00605 [Planctomycetota bacterium]